MHDVAGLIILSSETHSEFALYLTPSWSCLKMEGALLRIRCKAEDYPSKEIQQETLRLSVSLIAGIMDVARHEASVLEEVLRSLGKAGVEIKNISFFEPATPNENWKINAFDTLIHHVAQVLPPDAAIKQLAGTPLVEALEGYVFVPKKDWEKLNDHSIG